MALVVVGSNPTLLTNQNQFNMLKSILQFMADYIISTLEMINAEGSDKNQKEFDMVMYIGLMLDFYSQILFNIELD